MLQLAAWIGIYLLSMKFMKDYAGRNSPLWGGGFIVISFLISLISPVIIAILLPSLFENIYLFQIGGISLSFILTTSIAFVFAKILKKKNIRAREKRTSVNYRLVAFLIFFIGSALIAFDTVASGKPNGYLLFIVMLGIVLSLRMHNTSKANNIVDESSLNNKYILFLRSFDSNKILSKPKKSFSLYETWQHIFGKIVSLVETLERTKWLTIDTYLSLILKSKNISFVALGDPEDYLPAPGSLKVYTDDDLWKEIAVKHIIQAGRILLLEGVSEGLLWELKYIRNNVQPEKVLVMTYPENFRNHNVYKKNLNYEEFSNRLNSLGYSIPKSYVDAGTIFGFDKNWNARILGHGNEFISEFNYI